MKVVGAGFGRTGTASLKIALEELGFGPCYHMTQVFEHPEHADFWLAAWRGEPVDWDGVLGGYESAVDWPACTFYEELLRRNPDAKVLLSVRDPERWYDSVRGTIYELSVGMPRSPLYGFGFAIASFLYFGPRRRADLADEIIWEGTFHGRFEDRRYATHVFERHTEEVRRRVPRDRLLEYDVKHGWGPLCDFLGVEEPDHPFPHVNDAAEMQRRLRFAKALSLAVPAVLVLLATMGLALLRRLTRA